MAWSTVNISGGNRVASFSGSFPTLASAAVSGIPLLEWPAGIGQGRLISFQQGADAISAAVSVLSRLRRYDASAASTAFAVGAGKTIPADDFTVIDINDTDTVAGEEIFDAGDRLLLDKNDGGSVTRGQWHAIFALP